MFLLIATCALKSDETLYQTGGAANPDCGTTRVLHSKLTCSSFCMMLIGLVLLGYIDQQIYKVC